MTDVTAEAWDWNHERRLRLRPRVELVPVDERGWFSDEAWRTYQHICSVKKVRSYVYFLDVGDSPENPIKIGTTKQVPAVRMKQIQTSHWQRVVIRQIVFGDRDLEITLHEKWAEHKLEGEWFGNRAEVLTVANNIAQLQLANRWLDSRFAKALEVTAEANDLSSALDLSGIDFG